MPRRAAASFAIAIGVCLLTTSVRGGNLYDALGIGSDATPTQIRKAYRKKALELHPDKQPEERREAASEEFAEVAHAYETLSDEDGRRRYDALSPEEQAGGGRSSSPGPIVVRNYADDLAELVVRFPAGTFEIRSTRKRERREELVTVVATLTLAEVCAGKNITFSAALRRICPHCGGSGAASERDLRTCPACSGTGYRVHVLREHSGAFLQGFNSSCSHCEGHGSVPAAPCPVCGGRRIVNELVNHTVWIPPGAPQGYTVRLSGQGHTQPMHTAGDVVVAVAHAPHPEFRAEGSALVGDLRLGLMESLLGFRREVVHPNGTVVTVSSEDVVPSGQSVLVPGGGLPSPDGSGEWGAMQLSVRVEFPTRLSPLQRARLREIISEEELQLLDDVIRLTRVSRVMRAFEGAGEEAEAVWFPRCSVEHAAAHACGVDERWWLRWHAAARGERTGG